MCSVHWENLIIIITINTWWTIKSHAKINDYFSRGLEIKKNHHRFLSDGQKPSGKCKWLCMCVYKKWTKREKKTTKFRIAKRKVNANGKKWKSAHELLCGTYVLFISIHIHIFYLFFFFFLSSFTLRICSPFSCPKIECVHDRADLTVYTG